MIDMTATATPPPDDDVWLDIRSRYELGQEKVKLLAEAVGLSAIALSNKAKALGWKLRGKLKPSATKKKPQLAEATSATIKRLKDLLQTRIKQLEIQIDDIGRDISALSNEREIRSVNTLVRTLEKVLDLERKDRGRRRKTTSDFKRFDEQQRAELAEKIAKLQAEWDGQTPVEQSTPGSGSGIELPVALLGAAKPTTAT